MGAGCGFPYPARIIHHGADKLLIYQDTASDGEITLRIQEGTLYTHPLRIFRSDLIDVRRLV